MLLPKLSHEWRAALFDEAPTPLALVSPDHRFVGCNDAYCALVGYSRGELLARTWQSITAGDDISGDLAGAEALATNDDSQIYTVEKRYRTKPGALVWVKLHVRAIWLEGVFKGYFVTATPFQPSASPAKLTPWEWVKANPKDATIGGLAAMLLLGRDEFVELVKLWLK